MNMEIHFLFTLILATSLIHGVRSSVFTIKNNCPYNIAPGTLTSSGATISTGFELAPQASNAINMPTPWSGRVWARFQCSNDGGKFSCKSGDCGSVVPQGGCPVTDCPVDINAQCMPELAVKDGSGGTIGCKSACVAFNKPEYCCTGDHGTPETCPPTNYSKFFKNLCPKAYSYAYDDKSSTFTCNTAPNYDITFCP
ncbi:putative glucan endo-1,3-beta-D-glucosidase [Helianthus debilis subsp. tardiflorus]